MAAADAMADVGEADPKDAPILAAAIAGTCAWLVTFNLRDYRSDRVRVATPWRPGGSPAQRAAAAGREAAQACLADLIRGGSRADASSLGVHNSQEAALSACCGPQLGRYARWAFTADKNEPVQGPTWPI
jgi:hypothetical protein